MLALLILQLMNYRARRGGLNMSNAVLCAELADIREVAMVYSLARVERQLTVLSGVQKRLLELFDLGDHPT